MNKRHTPESFAKAFWAQVSKGDGCWLWVGSISKAGYGRFGSKRTGAHRLAWQLTNGTIPDGKAILHSCDTPACVNPAHLRVGDLKDNMQDALVRNRRAVGERAYNHKLTEQDVRAIRSLAGHETQRSLSRRFDVAPSLIHRIISGASWRAVAS